MSNESTVQEKLAALAGEGAIDEFTQDVAAQVAGRLRAARAVADDAFGAHVVPQTVLEVYDRIEDACDAAAGDEEGEEGEDEEEAPAPPPRRRA
jgi:hypothetical protein